LGAGEASVVRLARFTVFWAVVEAALVSTTGVATVLVSGAATLASGAAGALSVTGAGVA
jgi:hypothetical protein